MGQTWRQPIKRVASVEVLFVDIYITVYNILPVQTMFPINAPTTKPECIYGVIRPLYIVARIFGFFPFSVKIESNRKSIHFTFIDLTILIVQIAVYSFLTYVHIFYNLVANTATSALLALGMRIGLIFGLINPIAFLLADLCNRYQIFDIFNLCEDFDSQVIVRLGTLFLNGPV